jgi:cysteine desulfurase / selenocysteine lyase
MDTLTVEQYRREFPITKNYVYLDHAGIAPVSIRVKTALAAFLADSTEGAAFHYPRWAQQVVHVRKLCAQLVNAGEDEIAFIKSTSHGLSIVAAGIEWQSGDNVLFFEKDFPSNIYPWINLKRKGIEARAIPSRGGRVLIEEIERLMDARTRLISISSVLFSNGFRTDLKRLGELCRSKGVLLCVDAIQSLGIIPMDVREFNIDFLAADAHKWLLGPEGIGIFFCRKELARNMRPPLVGWKSVQNELDFDHPVLRLKNDAQRFEEGSLNMMGIFGLGAAIELLLEAGIPNIEERVLDLGDQIIQEAEKRGLAVLTPKQREQRGGNITCAGNFDPAAARDALRERGIMVNVRGGGLRLSPHFYNTAEEINAVFQNLDSLYPQ